MRRRPSAECSVADEEVGAREKPPRCRPQRSVPELLPDLLPDLLPQRASVTGTSQFVSLVARSLAIRLATTHPTPHK